MAWGAWRSPRRAGVSAISSGSRGEQEAEGEEAREGARPAARQPHGEGGRGAPAMPRRRSVGGATWWATAPKARRPTKMLPQ